MSAEPTQSTKIQHVDKPWGYELIWAITDQYVGKILFIRAGQSLSLQYHEKKEETILVESGELIVEGGARRETLTKRRLAPGESYHIPPRYIHRFHAIRDCRVYEVSTNHLADVIRLEDNYGRA